MDALIEIFIHTLLNIGFTFSPGLSLYLFRFYVLSNLMDAFLH